ncbi:hypothetical protein [Amycolatopsis kentuckyensis]|uniref:hypothetical protein n=1 Tax=Amycolatopsis kentuckyensis TaxID=218823 RepID=UPI000A39FEBA|nr:hypothetical protein [Amycolatopsis kentuckyensis]
MRRAPASRPGCQAYRQLQEDGVLEFRRGRGARVASAVTEPEPAPVTEAARALVAVARRHR